MISSVYAYPNLNGQRVSDFANLLTANERQQLTEQIYSMENITGSQFAIVTVLNTEGDSRVDYASHIGQQNGVGTSGKDNGVVILWSLDNEQGGAIATGRGIGDVLTDVTVTNIGRAHRSEFDNKQYYIAFSGILNDLQSKLNDTSTGSDSTNVSPSIALIFIVIIAIIFIIMFIAAMTSDDGLGGSGFGGGYIGSSGGWSSGGSSGSFSGGGFGGGGFGGGGGGF